MNNLNCTHKCPKYPPDLNYQVHDFPTCLIPNKCTGFGFLIEIWSVTLLCGGFYSLHCADQIIAEFKNHT